MLQRMETQSEVAGGQQAPYLSVRGDAERFVTPDSVEMSSMIELVRDSREGALAAAAEAVLKVREGLQELGGVVNDVSSLRQPIRWSTRRVVATPQYERSGTEEAGRFVGSASVGIYVRDFDLLEAVERLAAQVDGFRINYATWQVDPDNAAWSEIRLEAIDAAMTKGRDYATALKTQLVAVEHVADLGLLGLDPSTRMRGAVMSAAGGGAGTGFDPVPQAVAASVEARFRIATVPLDA